MTPGAVPRAGWLAIGAAGAAVVAGAGIGGPPGVLVGGLLAVAGASAFGSRIARSVRQGVGAAGVGAILMAVRLLLGPAAAVPVPLPEDPAGPWTGVIESIGSPRDGKQVARIRLTVDGGSILLAATLPPFPEIAAGAIIEVDGRLRPPPDDDPYGEYLRRTGASGSLDARALRVLAPARPSLQGLRDTAGDALRLALPEPEAGLAAGILIGLRERVDRVLAADFSTAGVSHIVAISGWNIAIVAGLVGAAMRARSRRVVTAAVLATVVAYVVAAGGSPSVVRAAVMAGVVLIARETGRAGRAAAALGGAATILLLVDPALVADAGFRLSVLATAGLLAWATPLGAWFRALAGGRVPAWLAESLGISLAAQAATLPDVLATFGRLSLISPLVNLAVVPLVPLAMAAGVLALAGGAATMLGLPTILGTLLGLPGWLVLHVIVVLVRLGAGVPLAAITVPPAIAQPIALSAACLVLAAPRVLRWLRTRPESRRRPRRPAAVASTRTTTHPAPRPSSAHRAALIGGSLVVAISVAAVGDAVGHVTRITVLDVGQGDAILLETRTGARMLIDGGPDPNGILVALDERIPPWDRRLDVVVLTHPHEDHVAGLARVLERYAVGRVYQPGMRGPGPGWAAWDAELRDGPPHGLLAAGARLRLGEVSLAVLWPDPGSVPAEPADTGTGINNVSIVLLGEANGRRFLLMGDVEDGIDPTLLRRGLPRVDLLKVAHHGSRTATTGPFVEAVRPRVAIASAGAGNTYGHPAASTLDRLRATGARIYRTDEDGSVAVELAEDGLRVAAKGARRVSSTGYPTAALARLTSASGSGAGVRPSFACAVAIPAGSPLRAATRPTAAASDGVASRGADDEWSAGTWAVPTGYDRSHDDPRTRRGRPPVVVTRATGVVPPPLVRRRGHRSLVGASHAGAGRAGRRRARRGCGAAARCRQASIGPRAGRSPPRGGVGSLAEGHRDG